jgi:hypothetical protein
MLKKSLRESWMQIFNNNYRKYMDKIYFVMTEPQTGDVIIAVGSVEQQTDISWILR